MTLTMKMSMSQSIMARILKMLTKIYLILLISQRISFLTSESSTVVKISRLAQKLEILSQMLYFNLLEFKQIML